MRLLTRSHSFRSIHRPKGTIGTIGTIKTIAPTRTIEIDGAKTTILHSPDEYLRSILQLLAIAQHRIVLSALYCGTGEQEQLILTEIDRALSDKNRPNLTCTFILDYSRAQRLPHSSLHFLSPLLQNHRKRFKVLLYRMPQSSFSPYFPGQLSEILGVYHCKFCLFDTNVILTGANLSSEYLTNRQDRYMVIEQSTSNCKESPSEECSSGLPQFLELFEQVIDPYCWHVEYSCDNNEKSNEKNDERTKNAPRNVPGNVPGLVINIPKNQNQKTLGADITELLIKTNRTNRTNIENKMTNIDSSRENIGRKRPNISVSAQGSKQEQESEQERSDYGVTSLRPLIQHAPCGVFQESKQLLSLLFPSVLNMDSPVSSASSKHYSSAFSLSSSSYSSSSSSMRPSSSSSFSSTSSSSSPSYSSNFIANESAATAVVNRSTIAAATAEAAAEVNQSTASRIIWDDGIWWNKVVIASPYPSFLPSLASSLLSIASYRSDNGSNRVKKGDSEGSTGKIRGTDESAGDIEYGGQAAKKAENNGNMCDAIGQNTENSLHNKNNTINTNITNKKNMNNTNNSNNMKTGTNTNTSKSVNLKIIVSDDRSHGFYNGGKIKKLIPKMHTYALQNILYQSVRKNYKIEKIEETSEIDIVKRGGGNYRRNVFMGGVSDAFSLLNVSVCPYYREGWTFHVKGIWLFAPNGNLGDNLGDNRDSTRDSNIRNSINSEIKGIKNSDSNSDNGDNNECDNGDNSWNGDNIDNVYNEIPRNIPNAKNIPLAASYIGSSNFGERSYFRDFELGFVLHTSSLKLSKQLQEECSRLEEYSSDAKLSLKEYSSPSKSTEWYIPYLTKILRSYL